MHFYDLLVKRWGVVDIYNRILVALLCLCPDCFKKNNLAIGIFNNCLNIIQYWSEWKQGF